MNSLPKTSTRQRHGCDLNPGPTAPEFSTLTTRLPNHLGMLGNREANNNSGSSPFCDCDFGNDRWRRLPVCLSDT